MKAEQTGETLFNQPLPTDPLSVKIVQRLVEANAAVEMRESTGTVYMEDGALGLLDQPLFFAAATYQVKMTPDEWPTGREYVLGTGMMQYIGRGLSKEGALKSLAHQFGIYEDVVAEVDQEELHACTAPLNPVSSRVRL